MRVYKEVCDLCESEKELIDVALDIKTDIKTIKLPSIKVCSECFPSLECAEVVANKGRRGRAWSDI